MGWMLDVLSSFVCSHALDFRKSVGDESYATTCAAVGDTIHSVVQIGFGALGYTMPEPA